MQHSGTNGAEGPLAGLIVLDLTRVFAGPYATMILGDLGATILKVEDPKLGDTTRHNAPFKDGQSHYFLTLNRNKKSLALDATTPEGIELLKELCKKADVLIENFRPGTLERLGLDSGTLQALNPDLIVCSISGFGQTGPLRDRVAYDIVNQAMSGILSMNGEPAGPPVRLALPVGDIAGGLFAVIAILAGLWSRKRGRSSTSIDIALHDGLISLLGYMATLYDMNGTAPEKTGSRHPSVVPYGTFQTEDGWFAIAIFSTKFWVNFCGAAGRPELASDKRFKSARDRMANRRELESTLEEIFLQRTTAEWDELCRTADVPASAVLSVPEALEHPQTKARRMFWKLSHPAYGNVRVVGTPFHRGGRSSERPSPPPLLGENTAEILRDYLDLDDDRVLALHRKGVVKIARASDERTPSQASSQ